MNALCSFLSLPVTWQLTALSLGMAVVLACGLSLLAAWAFRHRPAPVRYGLLLSALALCLAAPGLSQLGRLSGLGQVRVTLPPPAPAVPMQIASVDVPPAVLPAEMPQTVATPAPAPKPRFVFSWAMAGGVLMAIWALGILAGLTRMALGATMVWWLMRASRPADDDALRAAAERARQAFGLRSAPCLRESSRTPMPLVVGLFRPVILLPSGLAERLDAGQLDAVLLHETAHIAHRDPLIGFAQRLAGALFWWCPLLHQVNRRLNELREYICDNYVIRTQGDGFRLARVLVEMAEQAQSGRWLRLAGAMAVMEPGGRGLEARVRRLVRGDCNTVTRMNLTAICATAAFSLLVGCTMMTGAIRTEPPETDNSASAKTNKAVIGNYVQLKHRQMESAAAANNFRVHEAFQRLFRGMEAGDAAAISNAYSYIRPRMSQYEPRPGDPEPEPELNNPAWQYVLDAHGSWGEFSNWTAPLLRVYANDILNSLPGNAVLFAGTDPGRFVLSAFNDAAKTNGVLIVTQNALADNLYMDYVRHLCGDRLSLPVASDMGKAFQRYVEEVTSGKRPKNAEVDIKDGRVSVKGVNGVMEINGILAQMIFDWNKRQRAFFVEESYVIPWMYPFLTPHGLILKLNSEPTPLSDAMAAADHAFWAGYEKKLRGQAGFQADISAQKTYSKLRSAIGGVYASRGRFEDAEKAFMQARRLFPESPEGCYRFMAEVLLPQNRFADALRVMKEYQDRLPASAEIREQAKQDPNALQEAQRRAADMIEYIKKVEAARNAVPGKERKDIQGDGRSAPNGWPEGMEKTAIRIVRLQYDGPGWDDGMDATSRAYINLLAKLREWTGFKVSERAESHRIKLLSKYPKGSAPPFVYMTGSGAIGVSDEEVEILRNYLTGGGMLIADCGSREWDASFRAFAARLFPKAALTPIPDDDILFQSPFKLANGAPLLWHHGGAKCLGIKLQDRWAVFYHPGGMKDAWKTGHSGLRKELANDAFKLGANLVRYAFASSLAPEGDAESLFRRASELFKEKLFRDAGALFEHAQQKFPYHPLAPKALVLAAQNRMRLEDWKGAIRIFSGFDTAYPRRVEDWTGATNQPAFLVARAYAEAEKARPEACYWLGDCHAKLGDDRQAYRTWKRLTWDYPEAQWAKYARGRLTEDKFKAFVTTQEPTWDN